MTDLPDGEVGEIWVKSRQNMEGYWANPEATALVFPEGKTQMASGGSAQVTPGTSSMATSTFTTG